MGRKKGSGKGRKQRHNEGARTKKKGLAAKKEGVMAAETPKVRSMTVAAMVTSGCDQGDSTCQEYGVVGLANLRNTCYLNSVIQALMSSTKLQQHYGNAESWIGFDGGCLESGLRECFQAARKKGSSPSSGKGQAFRPCKVLDAIRKVCPGFKEEESNYSQKGKKVKDTFSSTAFSGEFGLSIACRNCSFVKTGKEAFCGISLPIVKAANHSADENPVDDEQRRKGDSPCSMPAVGQEIIGPVIERDDPQCISNMLGGSNGDCNDDSGSQLSQSLHAYVKLLIHGEKVSLKIVPMDHANGANDTTGVTGEVSCSSSISNDPFLGDSQLSSNHNGESLADIDLEGSSVTSPSGNPSRKMKTTDSLDLYNARFSPLLEEDGVEQDGFIQVRRKKQKGRKSEYRVKEVEEEVLEQTHTCLHTTVNECLEEYFSSESIHWRCPREFPERRIQISDEQPEVFFVPRKDTSRLMIECQANGYSRMFRLHPSSDSSSEEEDECESLLEDQEARHISFPLPPCEGLKSCLKDPAKGVVRQGPKQDVLNSTKQYCIQQLPNVLLVHLKRFDIGSRGFTAKLNQHVQFDRELDIGRFCDSQCSSVNSTRYSLRGVICHSGSLMGGHYVAYVLRCFNDDQWFLVSDHDVQSVKESQVLASQAYILMYELVNEDSEAGDVDVLPDTNIPCEESESCVTFDEDKEVELDSGLCKTCQDADNNSEANREIPVSTAIVAEFHEHGHQATPESPERVAIRGEGHTIRVHGQGRCSDKPVVGELCLDLLQEECHATITQV